MSYKPIVLAKFPKTKVIAAGISLLLGVSLWLMLGVLAPQRTHAAVTLNPDPGDFFIPTSFRSYFENCTGIQSPAFAAWIALKDYPAVTSATVEQGTASIDLRYVFAGVVCRTDVPTTGTLNYIFGTSPGAEQLKNTAYPLDFDPTPNTLGTYRVASQAFTYSPPGGFNSSGVYSLNLTFKTINGFVNGKFRCVGGSEAFVPNALSFNACQEVTIPFNFYVTVTPKTPISSFAPNCLSIAVNSSDGNFAAGPNWTLEADYGTTSYRQLANGRGNGVYNIPDNSADPNDFYKKRDHSITLVTYDVDSAGNNTGGGVRSAPKTLTCERFVLTPTTSVQLLPDDESPDTANFGGGATRTTGTTGTIPVKGVTIFRAYSYIKNFNPAGGNTENTLAPVPSGSANQTLGIFNFTTDLSRSLAGLGLVAGDCVRQSVTVSPGSGILDANGNIVKSGPQKNERNCVPIVNKPYVSFYGGDVNTCGAIDTFYNVGGFGSGVQYAAQAFGNISQFSSARLTGIGTGPKVLSFANNDPGKQYGGAFGVGGCTAQRDYFTGKPAESLNPGSVNVSDLSDGKVSYKGNVSLQGKIQSGRRTALYIEGDLNITGNIEYADPNWSTFANIPSLHVYVKGNIYVQPGVSTLTGFYVAQKDTTGAKGIIDTCANGFISYTNLSEIWNSCKSTLSIRGAFASKQTLFRRGNNSLRNANTPIEKDGYLSSNGAERFYIGPEMYLVGPDTTSTGGTGGSGGYQYETVLPPLL